MPSPKAHPKADAARPARPRMGRLPAATAYSGLGRTSLYEYAARYPGLFRKNGAAILVDFEQLDGILDALPVADVKAPSAKKSEAAS